MRRLPQPWSLKCFIAVAEELHFGRAAIKLRTTQPTLTHQVRGLEADIGVQLLTRSTRRVELTASGETFLPLAREVLLQLEQAALLSRLAAGGAAGGEQLNVGSIEPAAYRPLPRILRRFRNVYPTTRLDVRVLDSMVLLRDLERGECHVGLMRTPQNANLINFRPLVSDRFVAVMPRRLQLAQRPTLLLSDFIGQPVFTLNRFELSSFRSVYDQVTATGIEPDLGVTASNTTAALALVAAGAGITFLPESVGIVAGAEVVVRRVQDLSQEIALGVAWRSDNPVPGILPFVEYAELVSRMGD